MSEEDLLNPSLEKKPKEGVREGEVVDEASLPELTDADVQRLVDTTIQATENTLVEAPGEAREAAVEHLAGDTAAVEDRRVSFRQRAGDLRDRLLKKVRREKHAPVEQPVDIIDEEVSEPTGPTRMFESVDSVRPPLPPEPSVILSNDTADLGPTGPSIDREAMKTSKEDLGPAGPSMEMQPPKGALEPEPSFETGPSVKDKLADIIRKHPEQFDMLTETVEDTHWDADEQAEMTMEQRIADIELKQAALIYELYDLAGYVPGLRNVRDKAIPNIEYARRVINEGKEGAFVNLFTPEQLAAALEKVAARQVSDGTKMFGASFDDWVNRTKEEDETAEKENASFGTALVKKTKGEAATAVKTLGLSQAWRLAKFMVSVPIKSAANIAKASGVLGTRFASATLEKMQRMRYTSEANYPNVVKSADLLSRGADTQDKLDRMMEIQQKLQALRRERTTLQKSAAAGTMEQLQQEVPVTEERAAERMVEIRLWQDVVDAALEQGDDAAVSDLLQDDRPINDVMQERGMSVSPEDYRQMIERASLLLHNRPAIRDVCRKHLGTELQRAGHGLSKPGLQALQRGKFLYNSRADGSLKVELLLEPTVQRRRSEYDDGGFEAEENGDSLHLTIPADMVERLLGEATSGNYETGTKLLNNEALSRIFEGDITEPAIDDSLGQSSKTEKALANIQRLMKQVEGALAASNLTALTGLYDQIHDQYQSDQLGTELTFSDAEQQTAYDSFVIEISKAQSVIATANIAAITVFHGTRSQELQKWLPGFTAERANQLAAKFTELADSAANKPCRYQEKAVVTLPGKMMGVKEPINWTIVQAKNKVYLLKQNGKQMVLRENDLANWTALANKEAKAKTAQKVVPLRAAA